MLLVISLDGISHEDIDLVEMPNIRRVMARGQTCANLCTVFPSVTWHIHTCVTTGERQARHGVLANTAFSRSKDRLFHYFDPASVSDQDIGAPTIFDQAHARGLCTAAVCWPLTQGAAGIDFNIPEFYAQTDFDRCCTQPFYGELRGLGLEVDRYGDWSRFHALNGLQDELTTDIVNHLIERRRPDVILAHLLLHDSHQHDYGIRSPEALWAMKNDDRLVGRMLDCLATQGMLEDANIILFSDHGHLQINKYLDVHSYLRDAGYVGPDFHIADNGGCLLLYAKGTGDIGGAKAALRACEAVEDVFDLANCTQVGFAPASCPDAFPDLIVALKSGWVQDGSRSAKATHGYNPAKNPRLNGFLTCAGPQIPAIDPDSMHITEIKRLMDAALGL